MAAAAGDGDAVERDDDFVAAWIFEAIAVGGRDGRLAYVIAAADAIHRRIPSLGELERAVNRLAAGGLVDVRRGGLALTRDGARVRERVGGARSADRVAALTPVMAAVDPLGSIGWELSPDEHRSAVTLYGRHVRGQGND